MTCFVTFFDKTLFNVKECQKKLKIHRFWQYKPKPQINQTYDQLKVFKLHMDEQIILYGRQVLVNLIDQKGGEKILESQFADLVHRAEMKMIKFVLYSNISYLCESLTKKLTFFRYVHFDFHKECSKMRWHRLQILMDRLQSDIEEHGFYFSTNDSTVLQRQVSWWGEPGL